MSKTIEIIGVFEGQKFRFDETMIGAIRLVNGSKEAAQQAGIENVHGQITIKGEAAIDDLEYRKAYRFLGHWADYRNRGTGRSEKQFHFRTFVAHVPHDASGLQNYLVSAGKGNGIGPAKAKKLVDAFGVDGVLEACRTKPEEVAKIAAIDRNLAEDFAKRLISQQATENATLEVDRLLTGRGFPRTLGRRAIKEWGNRAAEVITSDPYQLMQFRGVGFRLTDKLYIELGKDPLSIDRQALCLWYGMASDNNGHTWFAARDAVSQMQRAIGSPEVDYRAAIIRGREYGQLSEDHYGAIASLRTNEVGLLNEGGKSLWLAEGKYAAAERRLAEYVVGAVQETESHHYMVYAKEDCQEEVILDHARCMRCHRPLTAPQVHVVGGKPYGPTCVGYLGQVDLQIVELDDWLKSHPQIRQWTEETPDGWFKTPAFSMWPELDSVEGISDHQREQLGQALTKRVAILAGSPGTGKSYTVVQLIKALLASGRVGIHEIGIAAPTGKACVRLSELMQKAGLDARARTWHSLLGVGEQSETGGWSFKHGPNCPLPFKVLIGDECFPAGTLVDTPRGPTPIEQLKSGDKILNAIGVDSVLMTSKKEIKDAAIINVGKKKIVSSKDHPFLTQRGFVVASKLRPGDIILSTRTAMRLLRNPHPSKVSWPLDEAFLQSTLLNEMEHAVFGGKEKNTYEGTRNKSRNRKEFVSSIWKRRGQSASGQNSKNESDERPSKSRQMQCDAEGDWSSSANSRREWSSYANSATATLDDAWEGLDSRILRENECHENSSNAFQDRYCQSETNGCHRSRWGESRFDQTQRARQEEDRFSCGIRVDSVEVLESGNPQLDCFRDESGKLYFYDIQATRHRTYSVNGLLVHNCSMVDLSLAKSIFAAPMPGCHVLLVGDVNQLPPVGNGAPLRDLIASGYCGYGELREIKRNSGGIVEACAAIRDEKPWGHFLESPNSNLIGLRANSSRIPEELILYLNGMQLGNKKYDRVWDCQVIVAVNDRSDLSRHRINHFLQDELNSSPKSEGTKFRENDKVVCLKNGWYDSVCVIQDEDTQTNDEGEVYVANGELGKVESIDVKLMIVRLWNPARVIKVPLGQVSEKKSDEEDAGSGCQWDLGYALSCHKCQGAEWPVVFILLDEYPGARMICDRAWIYTAISRAKDKCYLVGNLGLAQRFCRQQKINQRKTFLRELIGSMVFEREEVEL